MEVAIISTLGHQFSFCYEVRIFIVHSCVPSKKKILIVELFLRQALQEEEYAEFSKVNQDRIVGTKASTATVSFPQSLIQNFNFFLLKIKFVSVFVVHYIYIE